MILKDTDTKKLIKDIFSLLKNYSEITIFNLEINDDTDTISFTLSKEEGLIIIIGFDSIDDEQYLSIVIPIYEVDTATLDIVFSSVLNNKSINDFIFENGVFLKKFEDWIILESMILLLETTDLKELLHFLFWRIIEFIGRTLPLRNYVLGEVAKRLEGSEN